MPQVRIGGSFAPPLDADKLSHYRELAIAAEDPRVRDAMLPLCDMVSLFQETPDSRKNGEPHPVGEFVDGSGNKRLAPAVVPLEDEEVKRIWDAVPWDYECDAIGQLFETISHADFPELRNAAFHLLWFARELTRDREPLTNDKIQ